MDEVLEKAHFTNYLHGDYLYEKVLKQSSGEMQNSIMNATTQLPQ